MTILLYSFTEGNLQLEHLQNLIAFNIYLNQGMFGWESLY